MWGDKRKGCDNVSITSDPKEHIFFMVMDVENSQKEVIGNLYYFNCWNEINYTYMCTCPFIDNVDDVPHLIEVNFSEEVEVNFEKNLQMS